MKTYITLLTLVALSTCMLFAQEKKSTAQSTAKKTQEEFKWVNVTPKQLPSYVQHHTFFSNANQTNVGYCILFPPGYEKQQKWRYPVVYWLHGGRPGSELKVLGMAPYFQKAMESGKVPPMIYVFPNGGKMSHYDHDAFKGEQAFLELIKHVDTAYRTIADRSGRAVEGFSQGGRGTARYLFKHSNLFCSAAPMGGGHASEKKISENNGAESDALTINPPNNNTWDLAKEYAISDAPRVRILVVVGDKCFNYENNQEWSKYLTSLQIDHQFVVVPNVPHSSQKVYDVLGTQVMDFHVESFRKSGAIK